MGFRTQVAKAMRHRELIKTRQDIKPAKSEETYITFAQLIIRLVKASTKKLEPRKVSKAVLDIRWHAYCYELGCITRAVHGGYCGRHS